MPDDEFDAPESDSPEETSAEHPKRAKFDKNGLSIIAGLLVAVLAFAITVQVRHDDDAQDFSNLRGADLAEMLKSIDATNQRLADQIDELTKTRDELKADVRQGHRIARERDGDPGRISRGAGAWRANHNYRPRRDHHCVRPAGCCAGNARRRGRSDRD